MNALAAGGRSKMVRAGDATEGIMGPTVIRAVSERIAVSKQYLST